MPKANRLHRTDEDRATGERELARARRRIVADVSKRLQATIRTEARLQHDLDTLRRTVRRWERARSGSRLAALQGAVARQLEWVRASHRRKGLSELPHAQATRVERLCRLVPGFTKANPVFSRKLFLTWVEEHQPSLRGLAEQLFPSTRGGKPSGRASRPQEGAPPAAWLAQVLDLLPQLMRREPDETRRRSLQPTAADVFLALTHAKAQFGLSQQDAARKVGELLGCDARSVFRLLKPEDGGAPMHEQFQQFLERMRADIDR